MSCPTTVRETVCIEAEVKITPAVDVGEIQTFCVGSAFIGPSPGVPVDHCAFVCSQNICVQVPLSFHAIAAAKPVGILCGKPEVGGCATPAQCTHTIGFYFNNSDVTNQLIAKAGGSIVLGIDSQGLSFTVTTANASNVLNLNTSSPPAPTSPPFSAQYQLLYAQLLAANLNVLSGATCQMAIMAITMADSFLAASPPGGMQGAPTIQALLAQFNEGLAPGCPEGCSSQSSI